MIKEIMTKTDIKWYQMISAKTRVMFILISDDIRMRFQA